MAQRTTFLCRLIGLCLLLYAVAMFAHRAAMLEKMYAVVQNPGMLLLSALAVVTAGLAMVLLHNRWSGGAAAVVVTVIGWGALVKGLVLLLLPAHMVGEFLAALGYESLFYVDAALTSLLGCYLAYEGFRPVARG